MTNQHVCTMSHGAKLSVWICSGQRLRDILQNACSLFLLSLSMTATVLQIFLLSCEKTASMAGTGRHEEMIKAGCLLQRS